MKKTIYICIEIKVREFVSQILLSAKLILKGYRVYLGSKDQIIYLIKKKKEKGGIFFYKGGIPSQYVDIVNNKTDIHAVFDQELMPGHTGYKYYDRNINCFSIKGEDKVDLYFAANRHIYKLAKSKLAKLRKDAFLTGSPRIDLWKKKYHYLFNHEIKEIKKKYGNFYLFNSDFGYFSKDEFNYIWDKKLHYNDWSGSLLKRNVRTESYKLISKSYKEFLAVVLFLKKLSRNKKIIIRPHPGEDKSVWYHHFNNEKNIFIADPAQDVSPWILASDALLHRGCLTSLQSLIMNKPTYFINLGKKFKDHYKNKLVSYNFSIKLDATTKKIFFNKKKYLIKNKKNKYLKSYLNITQKDASEKIIEIFSNYKINKESRIYAPQINKILNFYYICIILLKRNLYNLIFFKKEIPIRSIQKIPNKINKKECSFYISQLTNIKNVKITNVIDNVVSIEKK